MVDPKKGNEGGLDPTFKDLEVLYGISVVDSRND